MLRLRHTVEQILAKLREAEVALSKGTVHGSRLPGAQYYRAKMREQFLNGELFYTLEIA